MKECGRQRSKLFRALRHPGNSLDIDIYDPNHKICHFEKNSFSYVKFSDLSFGKTIEPLKTVNTQ